jgi:hypothetical protein
MPNNSVRKVIAYVSLIVLVSAYKDLECKLALKTLECECYKTMVKNLTTETGEKKGKA